MFIFEKREREWERGRKRGGTGNPKQPPVLRAESPMTGLEPMNHEIVT